MQAERSTKWLPWIFELFLCDPNIPNVMKTRICAIKLLPFNLRGVFQRYIFIFGFATWKVGNIDDATFLKVLDVVKKNIFLRFLRQNRATYACFKEYFELQSLILFTWHWPDLGPNVKTNVAFNSALQVNRKTWLTRYSCHIFMRWPYLARHDLDLCLKWALYLFGTFVRGTLALFGFAAVSSLASAAD